MEDWSVSKGVFAYNKYKVGQKRKRNDKTDLYAYKKEPSFLAFKETWSTIENAAKNANMKAFRQILLDLKNFVNKVKNLPLLKDEIPTGILLAGVNLPDHDILIDKVVSNLQSISPYIATLWSRDCPTLKHLTEKLVYQIINGNEDEEEEEDKVVIKRNQCTFYALEAWHRDKLSPETPINIIVPDFESFIPKILHDFILILGSYAKNIKFILIFGVATTLHIVHRSLSYDATSKLKIQVFRTQSQTEYLSDILDGLICSSNIPFKVIDKAYCLLVDLFLYFDFSVNGFLQSYKICMWRHFYGRNEFKLCCRREDILKKVAELNNTDIIKLKKLPSLSVYTKKTKITKEEFKKLIVQLLEEFHDYINSFLVILKCLHIFTVDMPSRPFGKMFREIYGEAAKKTSIVESSDYKEAMKLMRMWSQGEMLEHMKKVISVLQNSEPILSDVIEKLEEYFELLKNADLKIIESQEEEKPSTPITGRQIWRDQLAKKAKQHSQSPYTKVLNEFVKYLDTEVFHVYLKSPSEVPLNEIFCYDDAKTIKDCVRGSMKGAIHTALTSPEEIHEEFPNPPDICVAYKLHLENRKMINMYDWLQAFRTIVDPKENEEDEKEDIDPVLQARFTQSVAELQFLGFIKATQRKTDHVKRLNI
ncbi:hypothetical protein TKK_0018541 [Trichogramma kaykai]|uniref:Origin recognition complex subunit 3 n=1 Tax=Trichogramma kaykai TaxID=54128 RepID=A0ABD2VYP7_9HYME